MGGSNPPYGYKFKTSSEKEYMREEEKPTRRERRKLNRPANNGCKYTCVVCRTPFTLSTAMDEKAYCSSKCEPK
jgi:transcription initiation factor IIE alpha subunit